MAAHTSQPWIEVAVSTPFRLRKTVSEALGGFTGSPVWEEPAGRTGVWLVKGIIKRNAQVDSRLAGIEGMVRQLEREYGLSEPLGIDLRGFEAYDGGVGGEQGKPQSVRISSRLVVAPPLEHVKAEDSQTVLRIDAKDAFGDGSHPSTRLSLELLDVLLAGDFGLPPVRGAWALDAGCGSGILALAGAALGGLNVLAVDISAEAVVAARVNLQLNPMAGSRVYLVLGKLSCCRGPFDVVLANLVPSVHVEAHQSLWRAVRPGGWLILAGFCKGQKELISRPYIHSEAEEKAYLRDQGWAGLLLRKPDS